MTQSSTLDDVQARTPRALNYRGRRSHGRRSPEVSTSSGFTAALDRRRASHARPGSDPPIRVGWSTRRHGGTAGRVGSPAFRYPPRRDIVPILVPIRPPVARGETNVDPSSPWLRSSGAGGSYALMRPSRRAFAGRIKNAPDRAPPVIRPASTPPTTGGAPGTSIGHWCPWSRRPARTVACGSSARRFACPGRTGRAATLPDARGRR